MKRKGRSGSPVGLILIAVACGLLPVILITAAFFIGRGGEGMAGDIIHADDILTVDAPEALSGDAAAREELERAIGGREIDPRLEAILSMGEGGDWEAAAERAEALMRTDPSIPGLMDLAALAHQNAGVDAANDGFLGRAETHLRRALLLDSDLGGARDSLAVVLAMRGGELLNEGNRSQARRMIEEAAALKPSDGGIRLLHAHILYEDDDLEHAGAEARAALDSAAGEEIRSRAAALIERIEEDESSLSGFGRVESNRFIVRFEGPERPDVAGRALTILGSVEQRVAHYVGRTPQDRVVVILYSSESFNTATNTPDWAGGIFDGRIRLKAGDVMEGGATFTALAAHEYAHASLHEIAGNGSPAWFDEGIAQICAANGPISVAEGRVAGDALARGAWIPLGNLSSTFIGGDAEFASIAYAESFAAVSALDEERGTAALNQVISRMGRGESFEEALANGAGYTVADLDMRTREFVRSRF